MMKLNPKLLFTLACLVTVLTVVAQSDKKDAKPKPKPKPVPVYLGKSDYSKGNISKRLFDSLVRQGLTAKDSNGKVYKITEFGFTYAERNLYEDSVGNQMVVADYLADFCFGDTLNAFLKVNIPERSKPGDTVFFDRIIVKSPEGNNALGKGMKFILTK